jgi:hypothetical protein
MITARHFVFCLSPNTRYSVDGRDRLWTEQQRSHGSIMSKIPRLQSVHSGSGAHLAPHSVGTRMALSPVLQQHGVEMAAYLHNVTLGMG